MSITPSRAGALAAGTRERVRRVLLACGPLSALVYVVMHEVAALQWPGYSRIGNAISELSLPGAPSRWVLEPWLGLAYNPLLVASGIGIWLSAGGRRAVHAIGALLALSGVAAPLWVLFGSANLGAHLALSAVSVLAWLGAVGCGGAVAGRRFRLYSLVTLAVVLTFFGLAFGYAPAVAAGRPTPFMGLDERVAFAAFFLWQTVLTVLLWRRRGAVEPVGP
ncbi:hypothetical protein GCM10010472_09120 [Pseudonocardia halophobica]|uniref:DUF998 domain-containing protein n=1 Tax=Pseudonocardia halophobica TaxID=29401 RepID=A0A9W6NZU9_9PSEU|nr:DUF998 domain-containing protein [Pseudonocardia halophobica]GLL15205.1 hypothetical protein GCM10017577_63540 [Pseudonocardia halophobica]